MKLLNFSEKPICWLKASRKVESPKWDARRKWGPRTGTPARGRGAGARRWGGGHSCAAHAYALRMRPVPHRAEHSCGAQLCVPRRRRSAGPCGAQLRCAVRPALCCTPAPHRAAPQRCGTADTARAPQPRPHSCFSSAPPFFSYAPPCFLGCLAGASPDAQQVGLMLVPAVSYH